MFRFKSLPKYDLAADFFPISHKIWDFKTNRPDVTGSQCHKTFFSTDADVITSKNAGSVLPVRHFKPSLICVCVCVSTGRLLPCLQIVDLE